MKVSIVSLGCSKNLIDSELITGNLLKHGHELSSEEEAEVIIVNTCGFVEDAKRESIDTVLELSHYKNRGSCKKLIMVGCLVERYEKELRQQLPEVDSFWGTGNIFKIHKLLDPEKEIENFKLHKPGTLYDPDSPRILLTQNHMAYVKVSEGCSRTCSFCAIPKMRGSMVSRPVDSIYKEVQRLAKIGVKEINLIAQDLTSYGRDIGTTLEKLLKKIAKVEGIEWIRLHYCYPWGMDNSLLQTIEKEERILPYIDMPLQHINDRILKLMNRKTTKAQIINIINRIRDNINEPTLRTTFIVGFPGETEEEFEELLEFIEKIRFDRAGAFKYSREEGTEAYNLENQVPEEVKEERYERFMETQAEISLNNNLKLVGSIQKAIIESDENNNPYARISSQAPEVDGITHIDEPSDEVKPGDMVDIKITEADFYDLCGTIVKKK